HPKTGFGGHAGGEHVLPGCPRRTNVWRKVTKEIALVVMAITATAGDTRIDAQEVPRRIRSGPFLASTNKSLAHSNKSRKRGKANKKRNKSEIGVAHENVPEIGDARDGAHRSRSRLRGRPGGRSDWQPPRSPARTPARTPAYPRPGRILRQKNRQAKGVVL